MASTLFCVDARSCKCADGVGALCKQAIDVVVATADNISAAACQSSYCNLTINITTMDLLSRTSSPSVSAFSVLSQGISPPVSLVHKGQIFLLIDHAANRKNGSKQSKVWDHGCDYINQVDPSSHGWRCNICIPQTFIIIRANKTSDILRHLREVHRIDPNTQSVVAVKRSIEDIIEDKEDEIRLRSRSKTRQLVQTLDIHKWRCHLIRWIIKRHLPFDAVEDNDFRAMLMALNQSIESYLVSGDTVREWIRLAFLKNSLVVKELVANALSRIHLSFDLWTSPNGFGICGICIHFVSPECRNRSVLIGMKRMMSAHSGEGIAEVILPVMAEMVS